MLTQGGPPKLPVIFPTWQEAVRQIANIVNNTPQWITPEFNAGDFTASGSMTWTVTTDNIGTFRYIIVGKKMTVLFNIPYTSVGGTPDAALKIKIPDSKISAKAVYTTVLVSDNGTNAIGFCNTDVAGTVINIARNPAANNWSASTGLTSVFGEITFEIQ